MLLVLSPLKNRVAIGILVSNNRIAIGDNVLLGKLSGCIVILLLLCTGLVVLHSTSASKKVTLGLEPIKLAPDVVDIGEIFESTRCVKKILLTNSSPDRLEIVRFVSSCGCSSIDPIHLSIEAGESEDISVSIDATSKGQDFSVAIIPVLRREVAKTVVPIKLVSKVLKSPIQCSPARLNDQKPFVFGSSNRANEVKIKTSKKIHALTANEPSGNVLAELIPDQENGLECENYVLRLIPRADLPVGRFRFDIIIECQNTKEEPPVPFSYVFAAIPGEYEIPRNSLTAKC
ncbi:MAG: DUF1573 domain-containing protein [Pirellulaceae bacterium]|nr:DUF1573 domain-containing protein [Pirellulaceae bacterium]